MNSKAERNLIIFYSVLFIMTTIVVGYTLNKIGLHMVVKQVSADGIDYDSFREMKLTEKVIKTTKNNIALLDEWNTSMEDENRNHWDNIDTLTLTMMINKFDLKKSESINKQNTNYLLNHLSYDDSFQELKKYYTAILKDIECFPIPFNTNHQSYVTFEDSWNSYRSYGGNRRHEGTDLMPEENIAGYYPVISMSDGIVEKIGWLEQGGYRIGIRGTSGAYYYYAHLDSYAPEIKQGDMIHAGQFLGYIGDSGYGIEGTTGMFDVHLHVGIYVEATFGELSVNPYWVLRYLEKE